MPKRLTAAELGDDGRLSSDLAGRRLLIEVEIETIYSRDGNDVALRIGGVEYEVNTNTLRRAAIEAEMKEPTLPKAQRPVAYLSDVEPCVPDDSAFTAGRRLLIEGGEKAIDMIESGTLYQDHDASTEALGDLRSLLAIVKETVL
jgi:hypothetical protein